MNVREGYVRGGNLHLWAETLPGARTLRTLCGRESDRGNVATWSLRDRKRCPECVAASSMLLANRVRLVAS